MAQEKPLKIISWNVNGIRSNIFGAGNLTISYDMVPEPDSNFTEIMDEYDPDIICFQETKCDENTWRHIVKAYPDYHQYWNSSQGVEARAGNRYSGTAVWTKVKPDSVTYQIPQMDIDDDEGRIIVVNFKTFTLINTYVPNSGTNMPRRLGFWDTGMRDYLKMMTERDRDVIWTGDLNVARTPDDVYFGKPDTPEYMANRMSGEGNSAIAGFLKEERNNIQKILDVGYFDVQREMHPLDEYMFTFWTNMRGYFRERNHGWRLDYFIVNNELMERVADSQVLSHTGLKTKPTGSDHCAIYLAVYI
jgi:exodeoxyribonuclease III